MKESHIFNMVEIALECNKLAGNWHHLFQRLFLLVFLLTSIKWGLSIWKHAHRRDLCSPRKVASLGVSEALYMVGFLFLRTTGLHVSQRPRDLKETWQKNEVNCKFEIWFETCAFKTKHSVPCLDFLFLASGTYSWGYPLNVLHLLLKLEVVFLYFLWSLWAERSEASPSYGWWKAQFS